MSESFPWPIHETVLENGLRVVVSPDQLSPIAAVNLWYAVGSRHEPTGRHGFAHLFEHLMFEGSAHVARGEHARLLTSVGGTGVSGTTNKDRTTYFQLVPATELELALWLEADRMGSLALTQETLDVQREVVKNERRQRYDDPPYGRWTEYAFELAFPEGHPYHHPTIGSMQELDSATLTDFQRFYELYYAPNNAVLTVSGDVDPDNVADLAAKYFTGIPAQPRIPAAPSGHLDPLTIGGTRRRVESGRSLPQPKSYVMHRAPDGRSDAVPALEVLSAVLGQGRGSRLYRRLAVERNLARRQETYTSLWDLAYGASVLVSTSSPCDGADPAEVEAEYFAVLDGVATAAEPVTDLELQRAVAILRSDWLRSVGDAASRADLLSQHATLFGDPAVVRGHMERIAAVTAADVHSIAKQFLTADNRAVVEYVLDGPTETEGAAL